MTILTPFGSATGATDRILMTCECFEKDLTAFNAFTPVCQIAEMSPTLDKVVRFVARFAFGNKSWQDDLGKLSDFSRKFTSMATLIDMSV